MRRWLIIAPVMVALSLTGCGGEGPSSAMGDEGTTRLSLQEAFPLPPSGITRVADVKITAGGREQWKEWLDIGDGDAFVMTAAASKAYTRQQLTALLWCAANRYAHTNGYAGWKTKEFSVTMTPLPNDPHVGHAVVAMMRNPLPDDVPPLSQTHDWCAETPPAALQ